MDLHPTPVNKTETECQYMDLDPTPNNKTETECQYMDLYPTPNHNKQTSKANTSKANITIYIHTRGSNNGWALVKRGHINLDKQAKL